MAPKILISRRWPAAVEDRLRARYEVTLNDGDAPLTPEQFKAAMGEYDALCPTVSDRITGDILSVPNPRVRIIGNYGAGFEHIDLDAAKAAGQAAPESKPILEVNPDHPLVQRLQYEDARFADWSHILFDQATLAEGGTLTDPAAFVKRLNEMLLGMAGK